MLCQTLGLKIYELSLRQILEDSTDGLGNVHCLGFYAISYVWGCGVKVSTLMPRKDPTFCTRVNAQDSVELDQSLVPAHTLPYKYTDSYRISFKYTHMYFQPVAEVMVQHTCGCHHDV